MEDIQVWIDKAINFATVEGNKLELDKANIEIPYPHAVEIQKEG